MLGTIEVLIIIVILGIIFGRDAIDRTFKKHPDETLMESLSEDVKDYYKSDPKRIFIIAGSVLAGFIFVSILIYWVITRTKFLQMIGL